MHESPKHNRRSIRLKDYDYSREGAYFITICTYHKQCIFGNIINGKMVLNELGRMVEEAYKSTSTKRPNIIIDEHIIMPNHFHGIIIINRRGVLKYAPVRNSNNAISKKGVMHYAPTKMESPSQTLGAIVRGFKAQSTTLIKKLTGDRDFKLWQRNYYEHVIRNENELYDIRKYIQNNPAKWAIDEYYMDSQLSRE